MNPGELLNEKYRIEELLGEGGMGAVYLAENRDVGRKVAIKVMKAEYAANGEALERFKREARAAAAIGHPGIVDVLDMGTSAQGAPFIVMERLQGRTLRQRAVLPPSLTVEQTVDLIVQVLEVLEAAHAAGVIHRDLKPDNIFVVERPVVGVKILDFGVSKFREGPSASVTRTGQVMGTPLYMAPEQARGARNVGVASDLYSIGAILYEVLSGSPPFPGETYTEVLAKLLTEPLPPLGTLRPDLPAPLRTAVERLLHKEPAGRFASASEAAVALRGSLDGASASLLGRPVSAEVPSLGWTTPSAQRQSAAAAVVAPAVAPPAPAPVAVPPPSLDSELAPARRPPWVAGLAVVGIVAAIGVVAARWHSSASAPPPVEAVVVAAVSPPPAPAPPPPTPTPPPAAANPPPTPAPIAAPSPPVQAPVAEAPAPAAHAGSRKHRTAAPVVAKAQVPAAPSPAAPTAAPQPVAAAPMSFDAPVRLKGFVDEDDRVLSPPKALPHRRYPQVVTLYRVGGRASIAFDGPPPCRLYLSLQGPTAFTIDPNQTCPFTEHGVAHPMTMSGKGSLGATDLTVNLTGKVSDSQVEFHSAYSGARAQ